MRICALLILLLVGCQDRYRYYCQDPDHFGAAQCQHPRCEFTQDCPEYLVAPILEKKIEGTTTAPANPQQQPTTNCR
jgi:hypothetical protein